MGVKAILGALAAAGLIGAMSMMAAAPAEAQQTQSRLFEVTKSKKLRVCQFPLYYSISFRNPKSGKIEGWAPSCRSSRRASAASSPTSSRASARSACSASARRSSARRPSNSPSPTC
jgi:hypothetical protein